MNETELQDFREKFQWLYVVALGADRVVHSIERGHDLELALQALATLGIGKLDQRYPNWREWIKST